MASRSFLKTPPFATKIQRSTSSTPQATPDFGGEVERVLKMLMAFCYLSMRKKALCHKLNLSSKKALSLGLRPIVVVNKIDKPAGDPDRVINEIFDLFVALDANDEQLEFPVVYAAAKNGYAKLKLSDENKDMAATFRDYPSSRASSKW